MWRDAATGDPAVVQKPCVEYYLSERKLHFGISIHETQPHFILRDVYSVYLWLCVCVSEEIECGPMSNETWRKMRVLTNVCVNWINLMSGKACGTHGPKISICIRFTHRIGRQQTTTIHSRVIATVTIRSHEIKSKRISNRIQWMRDANYKRNHHKENGNTLIIAEYPLDSDKLNGECLKHLQAP